MHGLTVAFRVVCAWSHCYFQGCVRMKSLLLSGLCVHGVTVVFKVACHGVTVAFRVVCTWSDCCFQGCVCME